MIPIIQIFKSAAQITKPFYNTASRKAVGNWSNVISKVGFLENNILYLPIECEPKLDIENADLIILQDIKGFNRFEIQKKIDALSLPENYKFQQKKDILNYYKEYFAFSLLHKPWTFELFQINTLSENELEIYFLSHKLQGFPKREDHKIGNLKIGETLRFRINSKDDFLFSEGSQRTFFEYDFVFHWLGFAEKIEYKAMSQIEVTKFIPSEADKTVDERKILN